MMHKDVKDMLHACVEEVQAAQRSNPQDDFRESTDRYNSILDKHANKILGTLIDEVR